MTSPTWSCVRCGGVERALYDGLAAHGAGWTCLAFPADSLHVFAEVCRGCGACELGLHDPAGARALLAGRPSAGPCPCGATRVQLSALAVEGAGAVHAGAEGARSDSAATACWRCGRVGFATPLLGRLAADHAGWLYLRGRDEAALEVHAGPAGLSVREPARLGPSEVPGLGYLPGWIDADAQRELLATVDALPWSAELKRRVQHYGWRYDYRRRAVDPADELGPLPPWAAALAERLAEDHGFARAPDQLIVNEYQPGQGISAHVDAPGFGPVIASLSLGSAAVVDLRWREQRVQRDLAPGSLLVLSGPARWRYTHAIPARKTDPPPEDRPGGKRRPRGRRVSLTFRTVARPS